MTNVHIDTLPPDPVSLPMPPQVENQPQTSRLGQAMHVAKQTLEGAVVAAEVMPWTNEASRFGAFGVAELLSHNPILGAAVLGGSTMLVEGSAAIATASLVTSDTSTKAIDWLNQKIDKLFPNKPKISPLAKTAIAMTCGVPALMIAEQREDPSRTTEEARRRGLLTTAWMTGVFAVEGALLSQGVHHYTDPKYIGPALLGSAALVEIPKRLRQRMNRADSSSPNIVARSSTREIVDDATELDRSLSAYEQITYSETSPQRLGLSREDALAALQNPDVIKTHVKVDGEKVVLPMLVPIKELYWYNTDYLVDNYGTDEIYYYTQVPFDDSKRSPILKAFQDIVARGGVIIYDTVTNEQGVTGDQEIDKFVASDELNTTEKLGGGTKDRFLDQYVIPMRLTDPEATNDFKKSASIYEHYKAAVSEGLIEYDPVEGAALAEVIDGPEAEKLWGLYDNPFTQLTEGHPINAGFDKQGFLAALQDPSVVKVVNRSGGEITTLAMMVNDFNHCPWLQPSYFEKHFPEAVETDSSFIFTGIVSDETKRGNDYSLLVVDLLMKVVDRRHAPVLVTFECGDISAEYVPKIVQFGVEHTGIVSSSGFDKPVSQLHYYAISNRK